MRYLRRRPKPAQVARALREVATLWRPPDEKTAAGAVNTEAAEGKAGETDVPNDADAASEFLSDALARNFDRREPGAGGGS